MREAEGRPTMWTPPLLRRSRPGSLAWTRAPSSPPSRRRTLCPIWEAKGVLLPRPRRPPRPPDRRSQVRGPSDFLMDETRAALRLLALRQPRINLQRVEVKIRRTAPHSRICHQAVSNCRLLFFATIGITQTIPIPTTDLSSIGMMTTMTILKLTRRAIKLAERIH